ncbi:hypothetical protein Pmani_031411 [Petrolisthes manimaculis]|uniref:Uncharacterized protein n=1 Tax=Petrolisthes manimaculis TaxID=1843537 RepID=A0AAE1NTQ4_9EUCA|nr:hypothetical protein Pmani_031411 [Petrolisthes manimaculis]
MSKRERMREGRRQGDPTFPSLQSQKPPITRPSAPPPPPPTLSSGGHSQGREVNGQGQGHGQGKGHKGRHRKNRGKGLKVTFNLDVQKVEIEEPPTVNTKEEVVECWEDLSEPDTNNSNNTHQPPRPVITQVDDVIDKDLDDLLLMSEALAGPGDGASGLQIQPILSDHDLPNTSVPVPQYQADLENNVPGESLSRYEDDPLIQHPQNQDFLPDNSLKEKISINQEENPVIEDRQAFVQEVVNVKEDDPSSSKEESVSFEAGVSVVDVSDTFPQDSIFFTREEIGSKVPQPSKGVMAVDSSHDEFVHNIERDELHDDTIPVLQSDILLSIKNESEDQLSKCNQYVKEDKVRFSITRKSELEAIQEISEDAMASSGMLLTEVAEDLNVKCQNDEDDDDEWETEPSGGTSEDSGTGLVEPPKEEEVWLTGDILGKPSTQPHQQEFDESDDLLIKGDIEAVLMALMEDQEKVSPTPPSLIPNRSTERREQTTILHQEDDSPPPLVTYPKERSPSEGNDSPPLLVTFPREWSPQVTIGHESRDRKSGSLCGSETESEGELVPCEDKCVGTADSTSDSDDETQDLTISESATVSDVMEAPGIVGEGDDTTEESLGKVEANSSEITTSLEVQVVRQGDLTPSPDIPIEGKCIGNSESAKEKEKLNDKKSNKKKGKKNKKDNKTEQIMTPPLVPGRPKLVRGKAWKVKTEKFRYEHGNPLYLSFGSELCESEMVEATSNLLTETYTEASLLTPTRCPSGTTVFTETPCTACSSISGEFNESESLHDDCICGEECVSDAGVVALVTAVKPCDGTHLPHPRPASVFTACLPDTDTLHSADTISTFMSGPFTVTGDHPTIDLTSPTVYLTSPTDDDITPTDDLPPPTTYLPTGLTDHNISTNTTSNPTTTTNDPITVSHEASTISTIRDPVIPNPDENTPTDIHYANYGSMAATHDLDHTSENQTTITRIIPPPVTIEVTLANDTQESEPDDFYIVKSQTVEAPLQVLTEYVVDSEDSSSLSQPEDVDEEHTSQDYDHDPEESVPKNIASSDGTNITDADLSTYSDATSSSCRDTITDSFDYEQSFPSLVGTQKLNLVYSYDTGSDSELAAGGSRTSKGSELASSGVMRVNVGKMSDDNIDYGEDFTVPYGVGDIVYEGPCLCGNEEIDRYKERETGTKQVGMGSDDQLCVPPLFGGLAVSEAKADSEISMVYGQEEAETPGIMDNNLEDSTSECDGSSKDIRSRINEIVGLRLQRERGYPGNNVRDVAGLLGPREHHLGRDESPLPGSSPASSSGVQGSDEMSLSRSRSRSPSCEEFTTPDSSTATMASGIPEETDPLTVTPDKYEREALESLRALRFEGSVESTPEKTSQVDCSFRTFRDMYQINPIYLTDSEDQNESDTEVLVSTGLSQDPDRPITVSISHHLMTTVPSGGECMCEGEYM